ncbi:DUF4278 domain-containing protein [Geitlerinema sp. PCC 7407]|uniref:arginine synthesis PII-interacting regulator PirA n=1 Tax=Geitlerinema sp. PCC 7407 TaxID=1173025 RepID=UPI00029F9228|nr:DUF4278 domain-containing protein [Geitlerinema sp. PCC 7407]AFY66931.1 hypothetical protein GEI7407_2456 [Geitlerinema sp. PCC 7407]
MKLSYRGVSYDYNPPVLDSVESELTGQYRGRPTIFHYARHMSVPQPAHTLTYRGAQYSTDGRVPAPKPVVDSLPVNVPLIYRSDVSSFNAVAKTHLDNIRKSAERRLQMARERGDEQLVRLLENELKQVAS